MRLHSIKPNKWLYSILIILALGLTGFLVGSASQTRGKEAQQGPPEPGSLNLVPASGLELIRALTPEERQRTIEQFLAGKLTSLTAPPESWRAPRARTVSLSNGSIAFVNPDDDLWLINPDGSNLRSLTQNLPLTVTSHAAWSPDGAQVAFTAKDEGGTVHLHIIRSSGPDPDLRTFPYAFAAAYSPAWSPDGQYIAFSAYEANDVRGTYVINVSSGGLTRLAHDATYSDRHSGFTWSPDGQWIAFTLRKADRHWSVFKARPDDSGLQEIAAMSGVFSCENQCVDCSNDPSFVQSPTWSPDGAQITFLAGRGRSVEDELNPRCVALWDVYVADPAGINPPWPLVQEIVNSENPSNYATAWRLLSSPNNVTMAMAGRGADNQFHIYTIDLFSTLF